MATIPQGELTFTLHKYQEKIMNSEKRFLVALAGIQSGKTFLGAMWLINEILKGWQEDKDYTYLIAAPTYKLLAQSTLRKWLELIPSWLGEYKEQKSVFELKGGKGIIYIRSTEEPYGLEGMTLKAAWLDEAGQMGEDVWRIMQGRLAILRGRCLITSTPYSYNWLYDLVKNKNKNEDLYVVNWESVDNPWFPKKEYFRQQKLAEGDPALMADFEKRYRGVFRRVSGMVYSNWHERYIRESISPGKEFFKEYVGGIDWGYTQPCAISIVAFSDDKPACTLVDEYYQSGKTIDEIAQECLIMKTKWNVRLFYADPSRPDYIQELNTRRIPVIPANNDIKQGISVMQRLFRTGNLYVCRNCPHFMDEIETYHYPEANEEIIKELPIMQKDHMLDATRYLLISHFPVEIPVIVTKDPVWEGIKESIKPQDEYEESMEAWMED